MRWLVATDLCWACVERLLIEVKLDRTITSRRTRPVNIIALIVLTFCCVPVGDLLIVGGRSNRPPKKAATNIKIGAVESNDYS